MDGASSGGGATAATLQAELETLLRQQPGRAVSASRIRAIAKLVVDARGEYKQSVYLVEKFVKRAPPHCRLAGAYVIDAVCRTARAKLGDAHKDVFGPRFAKNIESTIEALAVIPVRRKEEDERLDDDGDARGKNLTVNESQQGDDQKKFARLVAEWKKQRIFGDASESLLQETSSERSSSNNNGTTNDASSAPAAPESPAPVVPPAAAPPPTPIFVPSPRAATDPRAAAAAAAPAAEDPRRWSRESPTAAAPARGGGFEAFGGRTSPAFGGPSTDGTRSSSYAPAPTSMDARYHQPPPPPVEARYQEPPPPPFDARYQQQQQQQQQQQHPPPVEARYQQPPPIDARYQQPSPVETRFFPQQQPPPGDGQFPSPRGKVCFEFRDTGSCFRGDACKFSHAGSTPAPPSGLPGAPRGYKTKLCLNFNSPAGCRRGFQCNFAHSDQELQGRQPQHGTGVFDGHHEAWHAPYDDPHPPRDGRPPPMLGQPPPYPPQGGGVLALGGAPSNFPYDGGGPFLYNGNRPPERRSSYPLPPLPAEGGGGGGDAPYEPEDAANSAPPMPPSAPAPIIEAADDWSEGSLEPERDASVAALVDGLPDAKRSKVG